MKLHLRHAFHQKDCFLHLSPTLYTKVLAQCGVKAPLVRLASDAVATTGPVLWCVQDSALVASVEQVQLNGYFAEKLSLTDRSECWMTMSTVKHVDLHKVIVSLPVSADWSLVHANFEVLQAVILDQVRLVRRGDHIPLFTPLRAEPVWIRIDEFGGYQQADRLGILHNDTEVIVLSEPPTCETRDTCREQVLRVLPARSNYFAIHSSILHGTQHMSLLNHRVRVSPDDTLPPGYLQVPDAILAEIFRLSPKSFVTVRLEGDAPDSRPPPRVILLSSTTGRDDPPSATHIHNLLKTHPSETIIPLSCDTFIVREPGDAGPTEIRHFTSLSRGVSNVLATFILEQMIKSNRRLCLFSGGIGSGKTRLVHEAIRFLDYASHCPLQIGYLDALCDPLSASLRPSQLIVVDHVDEFLDQEEDDTGRFASRRYMELCSLVETVLLQTDGRVMLITRSNRALAPHLSTHPLPVDCVFSNQPSWDGAPRDTAPLRSTPAPLPLVLGLEEAKAVLAQHIFNPLRFASLYRANGMKAHGGVLLSGPPGSGKTFLAEEFIRCNELRCIRVRGPEILDKYVGASERAVRTLFVKARAARPCVIFFDEIDSLVPRRGSSHSGVTDRIVNQFLTELDGTEDRSGVFVIGTTSRPDLIDAAIMRPGRIDRRIHVTCPGQHEITQVLQARGLSHDLVELVGDFVAKEDIQLTWADLQAFSLANVTTLTDPALVSFLASLKTKPESSSRDSSSFEAPFASNAARQKLTLA